MGERLKTTITNTAMIWFPRLVISVIFLQTLFFKFSAAPESIYIFERIGIEPWGRYTVGIIELASAVLILVPRVSWFGAFIAFEVMVGAIFSHLSILGVSVRGDNGLLFIMAWIVAIAALTTMIQERFRLPMIGELFLQTRSIQNQGGIFRGRRSIAVVVLTLMSVITLLGVTQQIVTIQNILQAGVNSSSEVTSLARTSYFLTLGLIFTCFITFLLAVRYIVQPFVRLTRLCQQVIQGDLSSRTGVGSSLEIAILSHSLNLMLDRLQEQDTEIRNYSLETERLLRIVIHDIGNPLHVISTATEVARRLSSDVDTFTKTAFEQIARSASKIDLIIESTKELAVVRSGIHSLSCREVNLKKSMDTVVETFGTRLSSKNIRLELLDKSQDMDVLVTLNENLFLNSVLSNVISNAIKFSYPDSVIEISVSPPENSRLSLLIRDHGAGMSFEQLDRFKTCSPLASTIGTGNEVGTGFGLDIARSSLQKMRGQLDIETRPVGVHPLDHGTDIILRLPI